jgi:hypothetical protein
MKRLALFFIAASIPDLVCQELVRTQKFFEKGKAPPTLIENRELGLFFYGGATTVRSTE